MMNKFKYVPMFLLTCLSGMLASWSVVAAEAGRIVFVAGKADVAGQAAVLDAPVQEGDTLATGADGYVYVKTVDKGFLILRPNSRARIVVYAVDRTNPANTQVKLELSQGVARAISGEGVKQARQNFRFNTPVAAIGVRGTDFVVYTDQQASRVSVISGGVVMSGFDATCRAEGSGPCEGSASRELFAGQVGLLQIERGNSVPQLLHNSALSPDRSAKPRSDEPVGAVVAPVAPGVSVAEVNLDPQRSSRSLDSVRATVVPQPQPQPQPETPQPQQPQPGTTPPTETPAPVIIEPALPVVTVPLPVPPPAVPATPPVQELFWGRWQQIAGASPKLARIGDADVEVATYYGPYAMTRLNTSALVMPNEGLASFVLKGGEAVVTKGNVDRIGSIDAGQLSIDFAKRTFVTSLTVTAPDIQVGITGSGIVTGGGMLYEDRRSQTTIRGYLGGPNAEQAGYLFRNYANPGVTVSGATLWGR